MVKRENSPLSKYEDLRSAFEARSQYFANRTSCIFPVYLRTGTDLHIVFLNYWLLKSGITPGRIVVNFRVYSADGLLIKRDSVRELARHNQFSVRKLLTPVEGNQPLDFDGLVEVEIISIDNLRFPFPGVVGIYQAGNRFSAVHAAGRVKNADEKQEISHTQESNWTCKFGPDVTPFFHYFNGPVLPRDKSVTVVLRSPQGISVAKKEVHVGHLPPFGSQLFLVTDIFDCSGLEPGSFVSVQVEHNAVFPRLIVGNLFLSTNFLEVTHSFPIIDKKDYCPTDNSAEYQSMLCAYTHPDLALRVRVFPTNCEGSFDVKVSRQAFSDRTLVDTGDSFHQTSRDDSEPLRFSLADEERFRCLNMIGNTVPSRFNASYVYSVRGLDTSFSTDIADGADSSVYPPKWRHWGHAFLDEGYESVVLIRNNTHTPSKTRFAKGKLSLYSEGYERTTTVEVEAESATAIEVAKFMDGFASQSGGEPRFISWFLEMDEPTCETFWLVYRKSDGSIFGDHGI